MGFELSEFWGECLILKSRVIGDATLYLGDSSEIVKTLPLCEALITDPPYGVMYKAGSNSSFDDTYSYVETTVLPIIRMSLRKCKRGAVFSGFRHIQKYPAYKDIGGITSEYCSGNSPWGFSNFHPVLFYGTSPYKEKGLGGRPTTAIIQPRRYDVDHPSPKPLEYMLWVVGLASMPGETVMDPFMGSGTTGIACAILKRKFIGVEINPKYFDLACKQIEETYGALGQLVPEEKKGFLF